MDEAIRRIVSYHALFCPYTKDKVKKLEIQPVLHNFDMGDDLVVTNNKSDKFVLWSHVSALLAPLIKPLLIFTSSIPSLELNWYDRLLCLKLRFFEIWVVHAARLVNCEHGTVTFSNGSYISRKQLELIYDERFASQFFSLCGCLCDLNLSDSTIALYSAVVLYANDVGALRKHIMLHKLHGKYKNYLSYHLHLHKQPEVYEILLSLLSDLQDLGKKHLYYVKEISREIFPYAGEPVLLLEVFNVIKEEDIKKILRDVNHG